MKKYIANETSTCYVFRDNVAILKKMPDGSEKLYTAKMLDVNDSEIRSHRDLAAWITTVAHKATEIRDYDGKVVGIDKDALSFEDCMISGIFGDMIEDELTEEQKCEIEEMPEELTEEDKAFIINHIKNSPNLTEEEKREMLKSYEDD